MKRIVFVCLLAILLSACTSSPSPQEQGLINYNGEWITLEEYERQKDLPQTTPNESEPVPTPSTTYGSEAYETESYRASFHAYVQMLAFGADPGVPTMHSINPVGHVTVRNTDSTPRTFKVEITHYYGDEGYTKEFILQLEPGQIKTVMMNAKTDVPDSAQVGENYRAGDWGIDYQVTPVP